MSEIKLTYLEAAISKEADERTKVKINAFKDAICEACNNLLPHCASPNGNGSGWMMDNGKTLLRLAAENSEVMTGWPNEIWENEKQSIINTLFAAAEAKEQDNDQESE